MWVLRKISLPQGLEPVTVHTRRSRGYKRRFRTWRHYRLWRQLNRHTLRRLVCYYRSNTFFKKRLYKILKVLPYKPLTRSIKLKSSRLRYIRTRSYLSKLLQTRTLRIVGDLHGPLTFKTLKHAQYQAPTYFLEYRDLFRLNSYKLVGSFFNRKRFSNSMRLLKDKDSELPTFFWGKRTLRLRKPTRITYKLHKYWFRYARRRFKRNHRLRPSKHRSWKAKRVRRRRSFLKRQRSWKLRFFLKQRRGSRRLYRSKKRLRLKYRRKRFRRKREHIKRFTSPSSPWYLKQQRYRMRMRRIQRKRRRLFTRLLTKRYMKYRKYHRRVRYSMKKKLLKRFSKGPKSPIHLLQQCLKTYQYFSKKSFRARTWRSFYKRHRRRAKHWFRSRKKKVIRKNPRYRIQKPQKPRKGSRAYKKHMSTRRYRPLFFKRHRIGYKKGLVINSYAPAQLVRRTKRLYRRRLRRRQLSKRIRSKFIHITRRWRSLYHQLRFLHGNLHIKVLPKWRIRCRHKFKRRPKTSHPYLLLNTRVKFLKPFTRILQKRLLRRKFRRRRRSLNMRRRKLLYRAKRRLWKRRIRRWKVRKYSRRRLRKFRMLYFQAPLFIKKISILKRELRPAAVTTPQFLPIVWLKLPKLEGYLRLVTKLHLPYTVEPLINLRHRLINFLTQIPPTRYPFTLIRPKKYLKLSVKGSMGFMIRNLGMFIISRFNFFKTRTVNKEFKFKFKKNYFSFLKPNFLKKSIMVKKRRIVTTRFFRSMRWKFRSLAKFHMAFKNIVTKFRGFFLQNSKLNGSYITPHFLHKQSTALYSLQTRYQNFIETDVYGEIFIQRVRFKPGYQRIWRRARVTIKEALRLNYVYQYRLTRYLMRFTRKINGYFLYFSEFSIERVIMYAKLLPDVLSLTLFLVNKLLYHNGVSISSISPIVHINDVLQVTVSGWYYVYYRWLTNWTVLRVRKFRRLVYRKTRPGKYREMKRRKQRSNYTPNWIFNVRYDLNDVKPYLEVDYFTLSVVYIYEPYFINVFPIHDLAERRQQVYRLYNWKYIT